MAANPWNACPRCGATRQGQERFCPRCGLDYWTVGPEGSVTAANAPPTAAPATTASNPAPPKKKGPNRAMLILIAVLVGVGILISILNGGSGSGSGSSNLTGRFIRWEAVDDARGYAYFEVTNRGSQTATAECTIRVRNDFGNSGFDILVGEQVPAGETISGRIALDVGEGSFLIDQGEVTNC
jgi:hypothetical protein